MSASRPAGGGHLAAGGGSAVSPDSTVTPGDTGAAARTPSAGATRSYGSGARILSIGIAATGLLTFAYFSIASHVLNGVEAKRIDLLWSVMFVIISVIYRPIEQLLSRTIADRVARGEDRHPLGVPIRIQLSFAALFLVCALALHNVILDHALDHSEALYWVLVIGTLAYAASYFARGWLAGHKYFGLYGGLVLMEAVTRVSFALAVAIGLASGQTAVALGIAAAPFLSLIVVPSAFARRNRELTRPPTDEPVTHPNVVDADVAMQQGPAAEGIEEAAQVAAPGDLSLRGGSSFAFSVSGIMLSEQALLNAAVITVAATATNHELAGIVFNVLLIARAPLQLFQAIQTSLLPHLAGLEAHEGREAFGRAIRITVLAIAGFALAVALGLLAIGPFVMSHVFGQHYPYGRVGLAVIGIGMGLHLVSGTLNQAALARNRTRAAAMCWLTVAVLFVIWTLISLVPDQLTRVEIGYAGGTALLATLLALLYRRGGSAAGRAAAEPPAGHPVAEPAAQ